MSLPEFSIKRPVTILMACLVCILLGAISFVEIPVDLLPETEFSTISLTTDYEGVAPEEIETLVSRPLEQIVSSAPGVERVSSTSSEGRSAVRVEFEYGTDIDEAANEIRSRLEMRGERVTREGKVLLGDRCFRPNPGRGDAEGRRRPSRARYGRFADGGPI